MPVIGRHAVSFDARERLASYFKSPRAAMIPFPVSGQTGTHDAMAKYQPLKQNLDEKYDHDFSQVPKVSPAR
jgi:hypothetical protein